MVPPETASLELNDLLTGDIANERWSTTTPRSGGVHGVATDMMAQSPEPCPITSPVPCSVGGCEQSPEPCPITSPHPCSVGGCEQSPEPCPITSPVPCSVGGCEQSPEPCPITSPVPCSVDGCTQR
jgi:hypothetical protein